MKKKWLIWVILIVILIAFLFPKPAGKLGSGFPPPTNEYSWTNEECLCFGYKLDMDKGVMDVPHEYSCIGIPFLCKCIENTYNKETKEKTSKEVVC